MVVRSELLKGSCICIPFSVLESRLRPCKCYDPCPLMVEVHRAAERGALPDALSVHGGKQWDRAA